MDTHSAPTHPLPMKPPVPYLSYPPGLGVNLADLTFDELAPSQKKEGGDWTAVINPEIQLSWDIDRVHDLRHDGAVYCIQFSHDGKYIATGGDNGVARIFDVSSGMEVATMDDEEKDRYNACVTSVRFSPGNEFLITAHSDGYLRVWEDTGKLLRCVSYGDGNTHCSLDMSSDGRFIAFSQADKTVSVWNIGQLPDVEPQDTLLATNDVYKVAISPNTEHIAAGCTNGSICVWSAQKGLTKEPLEFEGHDDTVLSISFTPDSQHLISSSMDGTAKMWNIGSLREFSGEDITCDGHLQIFRGHQDMVLSACPDPSGRWVLSGSKDRSIYIWDTCTGVAQVRLQTHRNSVLEVGWNLTDNIIATGGGDWRLQLWRYAGVPREEN